jgi:hypothetical protein
MVLNLCISSTFARVASEEKGGAELAFFFVMATTWL